MLEQRRKLREDSRRLIQEEVEKMERDLTQVGSVIPITQLVIHLIWICWLSLNLCRNYSNLIMILLFFFFSSSNGFASERWPTQRAAGAEQREAGLGTADGGAASRGAAGRARSAESTSQSPNRASVSQRWESAGEECRFRPICHILKHQV